LHSQLASVEGIYNTRVATVCVMYVSVVVFVSFSLVLSYSRPPACLFVGYFIGFSSVPGKIIPLLAE
jgi:hypothetical protein